MPFCKSCGADMEESASFCTKCGAPQQYQTRVSSTTGDNAIFNEVGYVMMGMTVKPVSTIQHVVAMEMPPSAVIAGILALLTGILAVLMSNISGSYILSPLNWVTMARINPWGNVFTYGLVSSLVAMLGIFLGAWLVCQFMLKGEKQAVPCWNIAVASQVPVAAALLVAIIVSIVYTPFGVAIQYLGSIMSILCVYLGLKTLNHAEDESMIFALPVVYLVMWLILFMFNKITG